MIQTQPLARLATTFTMRGFWIWGNQTSALPVADARFFSGLFNVAMTPRLANFIVAAIAPLIKIFAAHAKYLTFGVGFEPYSSHSSVYGRMIWRFGSTGVVASKI